MKNGFNNENVHALLAIIDDVSIIEYNGDNVTASIDFAQFLHKKGINTNIVKRINIYGNQPFRNDLYILEKEYPSATITHIKKSWNSITKEQDLALDKHILSIHFLHNIVHNGVFSFEDMTYVLEQLITSSRHIYNVITTRTDMTDKSSFIVKANVDLKEITFNPPPPVVNTPPHCLEKQKYLESINKANYNPLYQAFQEIRHGCQQCPLCNKYGKNRLCPLFQHKIAQYYKEGLYAPQSDIIAHQYELKAARQEYKPAEINVATYLSQPHCSLKEKKQAFDLFAKHAISGDVFCAKQLITLSTQCDEMPSHYAIPWIMRLANEGNMEMTRLICDVFRDGLYGMPADRNSHIQMMIIGAEKGNRELMLELAQTYYEGKEWLNARSWYIKLNEPDKYQSLIDEIDKAIISEKNLSPQQLIEEGNKYYYGYGVVEDFHLAKLYYEVAVQQGNPMGYEELAKCYKEGKELKKDFNKYISLTTKAARKGQAASMIYLYQYYTEQNDLRNSSYWHELAFKTLEKGVESNEPYSLRIMAWALSLGAIFDKNESLAFTYFQSAALLNDIKSIYYMGKCYEKGIGVAKNLTLAFEWYNQASQKGELDAIYELGKCYKYGHGTTEQYKEAFRYLYIAANRNQILAQYELGECFHYGYGVEQNNATANKWYQKAAEQGYDKAQEQLGSNYYWGNGVEIDYNIAFEWYLKAFKQGNEDAKFRVAYCYDQGQGTPEDPAKAFKIYKELAQKGDSAAQNNLACLYGSGRGVDADKDKAFKWFLEAAEQNDSTAQNNVAYYYLAGISVEKNIDKALYWYMQSANNNYSPSMFKLGNLYNYGEEVEQSYDIANQWYQKAVNLDNDNAMVALANNYKNGFGVEKDLSKAHRLYLQAAEKGNISAINIVAEMYQYGEGVDIDINNAIYWYRKAANKGNDFAKNKLRQLGANWIEDTDTENN